VIAGERIGHLDQVALAREQPAIDARVLAGVELRNHPRRGLDIEAGWFRGLPAAREVVVERSRSQVVVRGTVDDPRGLRVRRTIRSAVS
jgi:hypothetical protein